MIGVKNIQKEDKDHDASNGTWNDGWDGTASALLDSTHCGNSSSPHKRMHLARRHPAEEPKEGEDASCPTAA